jgi:hypothetical protein
MNSRIEMGYKETNIRNIPQSVGQDGQALYKKQSMNNKLMSGGSPSNGSTQHQIGSTTYDGTDNNFPGANSIGFGSGGDFQLNNNEMNRLQQDDMFSVNDLAATDY